MTEHRFGSAHTLLKLDALARYLPAYTTALKNTKFSLHYVDAFAGTGACHVQIQGQRLMVPGSAAIALNCEPAFDRMLFIDAKRRHVKALGRLIAAASDRDIRTICGDANVALPELLSELNERKDRAVVFLDPYGMSVEWATLEKLSRSKLADVWYLFPLSGFYRQATTDSADISPDKEAALNRMLGTKEWRTALYDQPPQMSLLGEPQTDIRTANPLQMLEWVKQRLEKVFPGVAAPKLLYQTNAVGKHGAPLFALFFAVSNPSPKAVGLALKIANDILKH